MKSYRVSDAAAMRYPRTAPRVFRHGSERGNETMHGSSPEICAASSRRTHGSGRSSEAAARQPSRPRAGRNDRHTSSGRGAKPTRRRRGPSFCLVAAFLTLSATYAWADAAADRQIAVGATPASFEVDQQGSATYRIPIATAPGPGGLQPSLALAYGSFTGNGPLGMGWTIEGLSAIHRCAAIAPLHDYRGRVDMGADDRLCIDGRFLAPIDHADAPLQSRELRTRIESFSRVTADGDTAADGFTVHTKEGHILTYGDSDNARISHGGEVFSWLVSRVADRAGNAIRIRYAVSGNERHVERIDYGPGVVLFEYEPRPVASNTYLAGMVFPLTQRLARIVSRSGARLVREYRFDYDDSDGVRPDHLESITECAEDGSCLRPTVFGWRPSPEFELPHWGDVAHPGSRSGEHRLYHTGDFNGDGLTDIYEIHGTGGGYDTIRINAGDGSFTSVPGPWTDPRNASDLSNFHFADFDGDGLTDVYRFRYRDAHDQLYLTRLSHDELSFEEVEGIDSGTAPSPTVARGCVHRDCLRFGDFNGDARTDVYRVRHNGATALIDEVHLSNGDGTYTRVDGISSAAARSEESAAKQVARIRTGDFNGDGITDLYRVRDGGAAGAGDTDDVYLTLRPGEYRRVNGIATRFNFRSAGHAQLLRVKYGDFNGDGLTDVYYATPSVLGALVYSHEKCPRFAPEELTLTLLDRQRRVPHGQASRKEPTHGGTFRGFPPALLDWLISPAAAWVIPTRNKRCYRMTLDEIYLSHGDGHYTMIAAPGFPEAVKDADLQASLSRIRLGDFNGDGRTDVYYMTGAAHDEVYLAAPGGWRPRDGLNIRLGGTSQDHLETVESVHFADFNGDGATDVYHLEDARRGTGRVYAARRRLNLVERITDGLGAGFRIDYAPLIGSSVHELAPDTAPGAARTPPPLRVVAGVERFGGSREPHTEHYRYGGARSDPSGFGFLGFAWRETRDPERQMVARELYSQAFPYFGSLLTRVITLDGLPLSESRMEYATLVLNDGKTIFPHLVRSGLRQYEPNGAFVSETAHSFSDHDEYGNTGTVETVVEDDHYSFTRLTRHSYRNDRERWLIGLPVRSRTTDSDDFHADVTRVVEFEYDPDTGFLVAETAAPGDDYHSSRSMTRRFVHDALGNQIAERAESASQVVTTRREYDDTGRFAVHAVNAEGHPGSWVYDERFGLAVLRVDANGLVTRLEYDGWGRLTGEHRPDGSWTTIVRTYELPERSPANAVYSVIEKTGGRPPRRTVHDAFGRVLGVRTAGFDGRILLEEREYDRHGRMTRISLPHHDGERADWVERRYDRLDRLVEEVSPLIDGAVTTRRFFYRGATVEHVDELGRSRTITRDALGRIVRVVEPMGSEMSFEYNPAGRMIKAADAHGNETVMEYDALGNRVRIIHPGGKSQHFAHDAFGRVVRTVDTGGVERRMKYDRLGRLVERHGPEGTARWSYDVSGYAIGRMSRESRRGHAREFHYDDAGRLAAIEDHRGYTTAMAYDGYGRLREIRYPRGFVVERVYNEHGYLSAVRSPFFATGDFDTAAAPEEMHSEDLYRGRAREYASRASFYRRWAARLDVQTDAALSRSLGRAADELERGAARLDERAPDAPVAAYCEHAVPAALPRVEGLLADIRETRARLRRRAPASTHIRRQMHARMAFAGYLLDEASACLSVMSPAGGREDTRDRYVRYWQALSHDTVGRVSSERTGDGWRTGYRYHTGNGYLQEIRARDEDDRDMRHLVYDYDEADNLMVRSDHVRQIAEYFGYDGLDRVTTSVILDENDYDDHGRISFYRYDELGNMAFSSDAGDYVYAGDAPHAAVSIGDGDYEYDASGNLVSAPGFTAGWFSFNKPAFLERHGGNRIEFAYDANGNRVSKRVPGGGTTHYHGKLYERTLAADGTVEHRYYVYAGERLVAMRYDGENGSRVSRRLRYLHHDALGSVDTLSDDAGVAVARLGYTPFGERSVVGGQGAPMLVNRGFTGHEHLDEVGLVHMNGRIYDPRVGRFLSPDPYVPSPLSVQSYNRYSYALNNPMRFTDPSGFFLKKVFKGIKRLVKKTARFIRRNFRVIAAVAAGYYAGVWASNAVLKSAVSKLVWSPGGMWSGAYMSAYNGALAHGALVGGAVSGGLSSALTGGNLRAVLANAAGGSVLGKIGAGAGGRWNARRTLSSAVVNGATAAAAGGSFRGAALSSLQWGGLRYAAATMRRAMVAQSLLNPANAGGLSEGVFGDRFKLGGARYDVHGGGPSPFGGYQGGPAEVLGRAYAPGSLWDRVIEAYAGPHDYLNSFYWYDGAGNIKSHLSLFQRRAGEALSGVNLFIATPFAAAALTPEHAHALR